jgi:DNA-directed RNA polymerase subunit beta'
MVFSTTAGQLAVNLALPEDLRDYHRVLDKKGTEGLLRKVADLYPDEYRQIVHDISRVGYHSAYVTGGHSFGLRHMRQSLAGRQAQDKLAGQVAKIWHDPKLTSRQKELHTIELLLPQAQPLQDKNFQESLAEGNPLAMQVLSGARGNALNLKSLRAGDLLYIDHHDNPIAVPILRSYSQGLTPAEYYAGTFGTRKGVADLKFATQHAGFFSKQLNQMAHRLVVTAVDHDKEPSGPRGLPVDTADPDNEGALLAHPAGGYKRNALLTPKVLADLSGRGVKKVLVRSPAVGGAADGGLLARDLGRRERGGLPPVGDFVGIAAAQALSEPLTQAQISSKHTGGVAGASSGKAVSGFPLINQLVQDPKVFKGGAAHAQLDGTVQKVQEAPQGGHYVTIDGQQHYVGQGYAVKVKPGAKVEAGDVISEGTPVPGEVVRHKGHGEGRRYFIETFRKAYQDSGLGAHRRNIEVLARGLLDHARLTEENGHFVPGDIVPYSRLEHAYSPRDGHDLLTPKRALGMYLEAPVLHFSIGTKVRPSTVRHLEDFGVSHVIVHKDPPPFEPVVVRGLENLSHDPDWITRFMGSYLQKNLLKGTQRGATSDELGTSYVPALARAVSFGREGLTKGWRAQDLSSPPQADPAPLPIGR